MKIQENTGQPKNTGNTGHALATVQVERKTPKLPELNPLGIGFDRIFKFARVAKIFEKNLGVQIYTPPPPAVRGLTI